MISYLYAMFKKVIIFIVQVIIITVCYGLVVWLFNVIFDNDSRITLEMIVSAIIFGIIWVPLSKLFQSKSKEQNAE